MYRRIELPVTKVLMDAEASLSAARSHIFLLAKTNRSQPEYEELMKLYRQIQVSSNRVRVMRMKLEIGE